MALRRILLDLPGAALLTLDGRPARSAGDREHLEGGAWRDRRLTVTTKLDRIRKRELLIGPDAYTLTLSADGFTLALKGRRKGLDVSWAALVSGEAALATALNASLTANIRPPEKKAATKQTKHSPRKPKTKSMEQ